MRKEQIYNPQEVAKELVEISSKYKGGSVLFTNNQEIDNLIKDIEKYPHLFVLACLMDRQIKAERAWSIPYLICRDLCDGNYSFEPLTKLSLKVVEQYFSDNKLHRYNKIMSNVFCSAVQRIKYTYKGDASLIWQGKNSSADVIYRFLCFEGCGIKIASMASNLLYRVFNVEYSDYSALDASPDVHLVRVLSRLGLIENNSNVDLVIYRARSICPRYPGIIDELCWDMGRLFCHPHKPQCNNCKLNEICNYKNVQLELKNL